MDLNIEAKMVKVDIKHPATEEPVGFAITLRPSTHPDVKKIERDHQAANLKSRKNLTPEKVKAIVLDKQAASTESWKFEEGVTINGEQPECNFKNARDLYKSQPWIADQVAEVMNDEARFYGASE